MAGILKTKNDTATTTEASYEIRVDKIKFIANDNPSTGDLYISFNGSIAGGADYIIVKPTETFSNLDEVNSHTMYYKASTGTVAFRVFGVDET